MDEEVSMVFNSLPEEVKMVLIYIANSFKTVGRPFQVTTS